MYEFWCRFVLPVDSPPHYYPSGLRNNWDQHETASVAQKTSSILNPGLRICISPFALQTEQIPPYKNHPGTRRVLPLSPSSLHPILPLASSLSDHQLQPLNTHIHTNTMSGSKYEFNVAMSCGGCSGAVTRVLTKLEGKFPLIKLFLFLSIRSH